MPAPKGNNNNPNGRPKGTPNRSTQAARDAIAQFVDGNVHRLQKWLDDIADGKADGKPNPQKAFELFQSVIEYHVPKLQRSTIEGTDGGPVQVNATVRFVRPS